MSGIIIGERMPDPTLPRVVRHSDHYDEEARRCAECKSLPTRWWEFGDMLWFLWVKDGPRDLVEKHAPDSPVFLCDECTGVEVG